MSLIWIAKAIFLNNYQIELEFNNKAKGVIDLEQCLDNKIFQPLKDLSFLKNFKLNSWTIEWENGVDFAKKKHL